MSRFEKAAKTLGIEVAWSDDDSRTKKRIAEGKAKMFGERIVGVFLKKEDIETSVGSSTAYQIHLFKDFDDEESFGSDPTGPVVTVWGSTLLNDCFEAGSAKHPGPIQPGAVVSIEWLGRKFGKSGFAKANGYNDFEVGFFYPKKSFEPTRSSNDDEEPFKNDEPVVPKTKVVAPKGKPAPKEELEDEEDSGEDMDIDELDA